MGMEDKKFAVFQELRSHVTNTLMQKGFTIHEVREVMDMLKEDVFEEFLYMDEVESVPTQVKNYCLEKFGA